MCILTFFQYWTHMLSTCCTTELHYQLHLSLVKCAFTRFYTNFCNGFHFALFCTITEPPSTLPPAPGSYSSFYSLSLCIDASGTSFKSDHMLFFLLCLTYVT